MKSRNKVLSFLMAVVACLGFLNLPAIISGVASADGETLTRSAVLAVSEIKDEFDLTAEHNKLLYYNYCKTTGAEVILWNPDGSVASDTANETYKTFSTTDSFVFTVPGVYGLQYRLFSNGFYSYSEVFYIPVSNSVEAITFKTELNREVKAGTIVSIPETNEAISAVKVFTPYGDEVEVSADKKFTNNPKILGTYYIEYQKNVSYGGNLVVQYAYKTITFSSSSTVTEATVVKGNPDVTTDYAINISGNSLYKEEKFLYLYKYYDLSSVYVTKPNGEVDEDAVIKISVFNETDGTYYNFSSKSFVQDTKANTEIEVSDTNVALTEFILRDLSDFETVTTNGDIIKVSYSATAGGKTLPEKTITKTQAFNKDAVYAETVGLNNSEYVGLVVDSSVPINDKDLTSSQKLPVAVAFSKIEIKAIDGYDVAGLAALVKEVNFAATNSLGGAAYKSITGVNADTGYGIEVLDNGTEDNPLDDSFIMHFNGKAKSEFHFTCAYSINFKGESNEFVFSDTISWKYFVREESGDKTKPSGIKIDSFSTIVTGTTFVVPNLTAVDHDDAGNATAGVRYSVSIKSDSKGSYPGSQVVQMGNELIGLQPGTYTITYNISDAALNVRTKVINFKVIKEDKDNNFANLVAMTASMQNLAGGIKEIALQTTANYAFVYTEGEAAISPRLYFEGGTISRIEFEHDGTSDTVVMIALKNYYGTEYIGLRVSGSVDNVVPNSMGVNDATSEYITLTINASNKVKVNDKAIWFGSRDFEVEIQENSDDEAIGYYVVRDGNELIFKKAGTYIIRSVETLSGNNYPSETTVVVSNSVASFDYVLPVGQKQVAKKGEDVEIRVPVVKNYFGYSLDLFVEDSEGNYVARTCDGVLPTEFEAGKAEGYRINYKFASEDMKTSLKTQAVSAGVKKAPQITIAGSNEDKEWTGETIKYIIQNATAVDKYGNDVSVNIYCFDQNGKDILVKTDAEGNKYVEVKDAGVYSIFYISTDVDGEQSISRTSFVVEFPETEEKNTINPWKVIGIIFGSLVAAGLIALFVIYLIKKDKKQKRFINKAKQNKKREKIEQTSGMVVYTIAESKDEKHWIVKKEGRQIAKVSSKNDAISEVKALDKNGNAIIKVYNKNGRLIDSI